MLRGLVRTIRNAFSDQRARMRSSFELSEATVSSVVKQLGDLNESHLGVQHADFVKGPPVITYLRVAELDDMTMAVFVLPPASMIPLHDHPGMTVFSKVLWGSIEVESYDFVAEAQGLARRYLPDVVGPGEIRVLRPDSGGNVHSFRAREWTAVFDLLVPPYSVLEGRLCNYYDPLEDSGIEKTSSLEEQNDTVFLRRVRQPSTYVTAPRQYRGEQV
mmetsp:Transcript_13256/g.26932  ORF Transcript_13256/g.26932 Transcript_13256/m.26932 type:complete len:217 (-) Transcript_13256:1098-1748(-)